MIKALLVCDDSTGANASGILLNKLNLKTLSIINHKNAKFNHNYNAISVSTDSRAISSQSAYDRVYSVLEKFKNEKIDVINKRVDSTLRGNIGSELNAFHDLFPNKKIAIVPAYPTSKRVCINGEVYVSGISLEKTDVAKDPKMPIFTPNAKDLFMKQFKGNIDNIYASNYKDESSLRESILEGYKNNDALIFDAQENFEIELVSKALVDLNLDIITVDPGYFTFAYAREYLLNKIQANRKYIYLVGSVTDTTYNQLKYIKKDKDFYILPIDPLCLVESKYIDKIIEDIVAEIKTRSNKHIVITTSDPANRVILDLKEIALKHDLDVDQTSKIINENLAIILTSIIERVENINGIFSSGGDTSLSFLEHNNAYGIELIKEVVPLCVYGKIEGGKFNSLPIVTKGGMIGNIDTYILIKKFFEEELAYE